MLREELLSRSPGLLRLELRASEALDSSCGRQASQDRLRSLPLVRARKDASTLASFGDSEISNPLRERQKAIYGTDDRQGIFQIGGTRILTVAVRVVAVFDACDLTNNRNGAFSLDGTTLGTRRNPCPNEPVRDQPAAFCSGYLVAPSLAATTAHRAGPAICPPGGSSSATRCPTPPPRRPGYRPAKSTARSTSAATRHEARVSTGTGRYGAVAGSRASGSTRHLS
jgi:hypothetical protein